MHVIAPVRAVRRQPNRFTNMLVTGPRANIQAIPIEPTQAVKEKHNFEISVTSKQQQYVLTQKLLGLKTSVCPYGSVHITGRGEGGGSLEEWGREWHKFQSFVIFGVF